MATPSPAAERRKLLRRIAQAQRRIARGRGVRYERRPDGPPGALTAVHEAAVVYTLTRRLAALDALDGPSGAAGHPSVFEPSVFEPKTDDAPANGRGGSST